MHDSPLHAIEYDTEDYPTKDNQRPFCRFYRCNFHDYAIWFTTIQFIQD